jgi:hypothetical protein
MRSFLLYSGRVICLGLSGRNRQFLFRPRKRPVVFGGRAADEVVGDQQLPCESGGCKETICIQRHTLEHTQQYTWLNDYCRMHSA